jgi:hypothetical protein
MDQVTEATLERVRRFALRKAPARCGHTYVKQVGEMRMSPGDAWVSFTAEQTLSAMGLDFRWSARTRVGKWLPATIIDSVQSGRGILSVKVLGLFPVAHFSGPAIDKGELMRSLAELPWHPNGFVPQANLTWTSRSGGLTSVFDDGRIRACVQFDIDVDGRVTGIYAPDRPRAVGRSTLNTPWSGAFSDYKEFDGTRIPTSAEVSWHLPEGLFPCWRAKIKEFRFV